MHCYEYRRIVVPSKHWQIILLPWEKCDQLKLADGYWIYNSEFMTIGYRFGNVYKHVFNDKTDNMKREVHNELKPAVYTFFVKYFQKKCKQNFTCLPEDLCTIIASFLY